MIKLVWLNQWSINFIFIFRAKALRQYLTMLKQRSKEMVEFLREDLKLLDDLDTTIRRSNAATAINMGSKVDELRDLFIRYEDDESQRLYLMDFMFEWVCLRPCGCKFHLENLFLILLLVFSTFFYREEARNMWQSQEDRWKSEHVIRKARIEDLFSTIKIQVNIIFIILILVFFINPACFNIRQIPHNTLYPPHISTCFLLIFYTITNNVNFFSWKRKLTNVLTNNVY